MITAERLKELIKQGGTAWVITGNEVEPIMLKENEGNKVCIVGGNALYHAYFTAHNDCPGGWWYSEYHSFDELFETKDRAEWHCKMTAERTERFEPPMWEDIENEYRFTFIYPPETSIYFYVKKEFNVIFIRDEYEDELLELFDATKENYEKACEIVRDLFNKGGAK